MSHCCGSIRGLGASGAPGAGMPAGDEGDIFVMNGGIWVPQARASAGFIVAPVVLDVAPVRTTLATFVITKDVAGPILIMADVSCRALLAPDRARFFITLDAVDRHALYLTTPFGSPAVTPLIPDPDEWFVACAFYHRTIQAAGPHTITFEGTSVFSIANNIQVDAGRLIAFELIS